MKSIKVVGTHDGGFHSDEVFAIAILRKVFGEFEIIRTRDPEKLLGADMRVDVGGKYDHETRDYDHHQKEFTEERENGIQYSSAGLIWKHYGRELVESDEAFEKINGNLIEFLDAEDTGVDYALGNVTIYEMGQTIRSFNPSWKGKEDPDQQFKKAVEFAVIILDNEIRRANDSIEGIQLVKKAIEENDKEKYIVLEQIGLPLKPLIEDEKLLYSVSQRKDGNWNALALKKKSESFESKKDFPETWGGLMGEELEEVSGVKGAIFCHKALFICGAKTKEAIIEMVEKAIQA